MRRLLSMSVVMVSVVSCSPAELNTCSTACSHLQTLCGAPTIGCESQCVAWAPAFRSCVLSSSTCASAATCDSSAGGGSAGGGSAGGGSAGGGSAGGGSAGGGSAGGTIATGGGNGTMCTNGLSVGEAICEFGGDTLVACDQRPGFIQALRRVCGGTTPSCAAEIVGGRPYAACCRAGNVGNPRETGCTH